MGGIHPWGDYFSFVPNGFKPQPLLIKRCLFIPQKHSGGLWLQLGSMVTRYEVNRGVMPLQERIDFCRKTYKKAKQYSFQLQRTSSKEKAQFLKLNVKLNQNGGQWDGGEDSGHFKWRLHQQRHIPQSIGHNGGGRRAPWKRGCISHNDLHNLEELG